MFVQVRLQISLCNLFRKYLRQAQKSVCALVSSGPNIVRSTGKLKWLAIFLQYYI
jgi:hypothetical protein